eukprot:SAG22_NODE_1624_length_3958_cov_606.690593_1_plen_149_part_00
MFLEWQDAGPAGFRKKQGYGNALMFRRKRGESTEQFVGRGVAYTQKSANMEGHWGDFRRHIKNMPKLAAMLVVSTLITLIAVVGFFIITEIYIWLGCVYIHNAYMVYCRGLDTLRIFGRDYYFSFQYIVMGEFTACVMAGCGWLLDLM